MNSPRLTWIEQLEEDNASMIVDLNVYPLDILFRTCYEFTDRCYLFLIPDKEVSKVRIRFSKKTTIGDLSKLIGEFCNNLIDQRLRRDIAAETRSIRELIVAQAFAESDLLADSETEGDYTQDPKGISR